MGGGRNVARSNLFRPFGLQFPPGKVAQLLRFNNNSVIDRHHRQVGNRQKKWVRYAFLLIWMVVSCMVANAQSRVVVMPNRGVDTIYLSQDTCYTILDPGGLQKYAHNEDSWLYIISPHLNFNLKVTYQTGAYDDGGDWIRIYDEPNPNTGSYHYCCGEGTDDIDNWWGGVLIHFHSNNYAAYDGFEIQVRYMNTISNQSVQLVNDTTVTLTWSDDNTNASQWVVSYYFDEDSVQQTAVTSPTATLSHLRKNTHYCYTITNNTTACMKTEKRYFLTGG